MYSSPEGDVVVPNVDLLSFCFENRSKYDENKPIFIDAYNPSRQLTAISFTRLVRILIAGLRALGVRDGDCVLCQIPNSYYYAAIYFAIIGAGGVWCGSNPANEVTEVDHLLELAQPCLTITCKQTLSTFIEAYEQKQLEKKNILVLDSENISHQLDKLLDDAYDVGKEGNEKRTCTRSFTDLFQYGEQDWQVISDEEKLKTTPVAYYPTSGTTGLPKLAMHTHYSSVAHHLTIHQDVPYQPSRLISLPLFHVFGAGYTYIQPIKYGHSTYVMERFQLEDYLHNIDRFQVTETFMAPPIVFALLRSSLDVKDSIKTLRFIGCGGAPIDADSIKKMRSLMASNATFTKIWGMTEINMVTSFRYGEVDETGSVGRLLRGIEVKLMDANRNEVENDTDAGEVYIRSPGNMLGYHNKSAAKEWYRTGDICRVGDGKFYIVGREKELIKVKGWQVAPPELEEVLLEHPHVLDAAVVGTVAKDGVTEVPRAYIVRRKVSKESDMITTEEVYNFSSDRLASYKALDGGICFVEEIPRNPSGKILRSKLSGMEQDKPAVSDVLMATDKMTAASSDQQEVAHVKSMPLKDVQYMANSQHSMQSKRIPSTA